MIKSKAELSREIEAKSTSYSPEELFSSNYFYSHLQEVINSVCYSKRRTPYINAYCDPEDNFTAATEGTKVIINTLNPLIREIKTIWEQYVSIFGNITHEIGHVLYSPFEHLNPLRQNWNAETFSFYPKNPNVEGAQEFVDYLNSHPNYRKIFVHDMMDIANIMEDVYIENRLYEDFDGLCTAGLHKANDEKYRLSPEIEEMYLQSSMGMIMPLTVAKAIMQLKKLGYEPKHMKVDFSEIEKDAGKEMAEFIEIIFDKVKNLVEDGLASVDKELDELAWENDGLKRCELLNTIFVKLRPLVPEPPESQDYGNSPDSQGSDENQDGQQQDSSGGSSQGSGQGNGSSSDYSEGQANQMNSNSDKVSQETGVSNEAKGEGKPADKSKPNKEKSQKGKDKAGEFSNSEDACKDEFKRGAKSIAKEECETKDEIEHKKELQKEANDIMKNGNKRGSAYFTKTTIERLNKSEIDSFPQLKQMYEAIYSEVSKTSNNLARKIRNILKDREVETSETGLLMGQRFESRDVYRGDGKYFSKISEPGEQIKACFGVLIDLSGSMGGKKIENARRTAILMEDTLRKLNVPFTIIGHNHHGSNVVLHPFVDFDTNDGYDKYRLAGIQPGGNNIDGVAIRHICEKLLKRPEQLKILIVISDGMPCGVSYYHDYDSDEDVKIGVNYYRKKGIKILSQVVDSYALESLQRIYGNNYTFDSASLDRLEAEFVKIIKKYCLMK